NPRGYAGRRRWRACWWLRSWWCGRVDVVQFAFRWGHASAWPLTPALSPRGRGFSGFRPALWSRGSGVGQLFDEEGGQMLAQRLVRQIIQHRATERGSQQRACLGQRDAARTQVEQRTLVELADGGSVGGLHFVGIDFKLRLGVDLGTRRQQQVLVAEVGVAAVGAG